MYYENHFIDNGVINCLMKDTEYSHETVVERCTLDKALFDFMTEIVEEWPFSKLTEDQRERLYMLLVNPVWTDVNEDITNLRIFKEYRSRRRLLSNMYYSFLIGCGYTVDDFVYVPFDDFRYFCPKCIERFGRSISAQPGGSSTCDPSMRWNCVQKIVGDKSVMSIEKGGCRDE